MKPQISVIIHTRNEESNIAACIKSCQNIASEIVIIDMSSTDKTVEIAKKCRSKVIEVPYEGYVETMRQVGINAATFDWILILDADERLTPLLRKLIALFTTAPTADICRLPRKNIVLGRWLQYGLQWPDYQVRLFKKGSVRWPTTIHAQPVCNGRIVDFDADPEKAILHQHSSTVQQLVNKIEHHAAYENHYSNLKSVTANNVAKRMNREFYWRFFEHEGWKDGIEGYIMAKFMEYYRFLEFANYWDKHRSKIHFSRSDINTLLAPYKPPTSTSRFERYSTRLLKLLHLC